MGKGQQRMLDWSDQQVRRFQLWLLLCCSGLMALSLFVASAQQPLYYQQAFGIEAIMEQHNARELAATMHLLLCLLIAMSLWRDSARSALSLVMLAVGAIGLLPLLLEVNINPLGIDMPLVYSGRGAVKYGVLLALALCWLNPHWPRLLQRAMLLAPIVGLLLWSGLAKFSVAEQQQLLPLMADSAAYGWIAALWSPQLALLVMTVVQLGAGLLLLLSLRWQACQGFGSALFMVHLLSLLVRLPLWEGAWASWGALSAAGQFIIKELWLLAALVGYWQLSQKKAQQAP